MSSLAKAFVFLQLSYLTSAASAALVRYDFEIFDITPGMELLGEGFFVLDDEIMPQVPGLLNDTGLLLGLSFRWNGIVFDETTAMSGFAGFTPDGVVDSIFFGNDCGLGFCSVSSGSGEWMIAAGLDILAGGITYTFSDQPGFAIANMVLSGPTPVPLAPSAAFLLSGLVGLSALRRRRQARA